MFMGVGLVEIPRSSWRKGNLGVQLRHHHFKAASGYDELSTAHEVLLKVEKQIKQLDELVSPRDENRRYVNALIEECTAEYHMLDHGEGQVSTDYANIVSLRAQLRSAKHNWNQANAYAQIQIQTDRAPLLVSTQFTDLWFGFVQTLRGYFADSLPIGRCDSVPRIQSETVRHSVRSCGRKLMAYGPGCVV